MTGLSRGVYGGGTLVTWGYVGYGFALFVTILLNDQIPVDNAQVLV